VSEEKRKSQRGASSTGAAGPMELVAQARALFHHQRAEAVKVGRQAIDAARASGNAAAAALALNLLADADRVKEVGTLPNFLRIRRESGAWDRLGRGGGDGDGVVAVRPGGKSGGKSGHFPISCVSGENPEPVTGLGHGNWRVTIADFRLADD